MRRCGGSSPGSIPAGIWNAFRRTIRSSPGGPTVSPAAVFSAEAAARYPDERYPLLYGIADGDRLPLIYSPVDLAGGWQQVPRPGSVMYTPEAAGRLGGSIASYFLTH
ncbi:MAG: hypothetical protein L6W00_06395 [Lentisphaeria bacterium]|nr:MAG: hypothetical protein L6W00_06395 [Lentisphaeria bacterium]